MTDGSRLDWRDRVALACACAVVVGACFTIPSVGMSLEDLVWEGVFAARSAREILCEPLGSYRPLCGGLLVLQSTWPVEAKLAAGLAGHLAAAVMAGALGWRLTRRPSSAVFGAAIPLAWATQSEVTLWLGGRCDLLHTLLGLAGAHALLRGLETARLRFSVVTTSCVVLAAFAKEPGVLLPLAYLPLAARFERAEAVRQLALPALGAAAALLVHVVVAGGASPYVAGHLSRGVFGAVANVVLACTTLALGALFDWPNALAVVVTLALAGVAVAVLFHLRRAEGARGYVASWLVALVALLAPTALVHAPRTLYPTVAFLGVSVGVALATYPKLRSVALAVVVTHAAMAIASQRVWAAMIAQRDELRAEIGAETRAGERILVLGARQRPMRVSAAALPLLTWSERRAADLLPLPYDENALRILAAAELLELAECRARLRYRVPPGPRGVPDGVRVAIEREVVSLEVGEPVALVYGDALGRPRFVRIPCRHPHPVRE